MRDVRGEGPHPARRPQGSLTVTASTPTGGGLGVGWLVSAGAFFALGDGGPYALTRAVRVGWEFDRKKAEKTGVPPRPGFAVYMAATVLALMAGIPLGLLVFDIAAR